MSGARLPAVLLAVLLLAAGPPAAAAPDFAAMRFEPYSPTKPAPAVMLPDLAGKPWSLAQQRGKIVMLFFWATW